MKKQAAKDTAEATIGTVANTFLNPLATLMPGKYWMPEAAITSPETKGRPSQFPFTGNSTFDQLVLHTGAVGVSALALSALARMISHVSDKGKAQKREARETASIVRSSNPIFSPDPDLGDIEAEKALNVQGLKKKGDDPYWALKAVAPVAMMVGGGYAGYQLVDKILERRRKTGLDSDIGNLSNKLDRLNYMKIMRARGIEVPDDAPKQDVADADKAEGSAPVMGKIAEDEVKTEKKPIEGYGSDPMSVIKAIVALITASTAVSAGILSKRYFDSTDPARQEMKEVNAAMRALKRQEIQNEPINVTALPMDIKRDADTHLLPGAKKLPQEAAKIEATPLDSPMVDKTDPTMAML